MKREFLKIEIWNAGPVITATGLHINKHTIG